MAVSIERSPVAPNPGANTEQSAEIARQGQVGNRRVSTSGGGYVSPIRESVNNATVATPISERNVGLVPDDPARLPISWFTKRLPGGAKLGGPHQDHFQLDLEIKFKSKSLTEDLRNVVHFARQIDKDILRASELLYKSDQKQKPLNEKEQREVNGLLGAGKYNLAQVQRWTSVARDQFEGIHAHTSLEFITKLQERLADRHMDLADLMCQYDLDQTPPEQAVSRADRIDHNLIAADAALDVARGLTGNSLPGEAQQQLVAVLDDHRTQLARAKDVALGRACDSAYAPLALPSYDEVALPSYDDAMGINPASSSDSGSDSVQVLSKEMWGTFDLIKGKKAGDSMAAMHQHWDGKAAGATGSWLPLTHPKLTQDQMLQEFVSYQLKRAGVAKEIRPYIKFQFKEATNRVRNERPWEPIEKQLHYTVAGEERTVYSTITPTKVMAGADHFTEDLPANGICCGDRMQYTHVPNMARTELTDESGKTLFSALRHGVLDAYDISASNLRKLPKQALRTMVKDLLIPRMGKNEKQRVRQIVDAIPTNKTLATQVASAMRTAASANMAKELAVAALVSDPDKLQAALDGKEVALTLSSISLLTPDWIRSTPISKAHSDEREMLTRQTEALKNLDSATRVLQGQKPLNLQVRNASGELRTVAVNCKVRTFNFGVNAGAVGRAKHIPSHTHGWDKLMGWGYAMERNNPDLRALLGDPKSLTLGGEVGDKLTELERKTKTLQAELPIMKIAASRNSEIVATIPEFERELATMTQSMDTLKDAAEDAKKIWREGSYNKGGQDPYKMVSRLGLVINEMGETLAFNCKSGKDRTGQLDAELKYLTTLSTADRLPEPGAPTTPELRQMRSDFTLNSGNLEMQRMNTGLPGFKLDIKEVPGLANFIEPGMESRYRGGSNYINS